MHFLLTNDDGIDAPGIAAAHAALQEMGTVHIVAPISERSACSHSLSLYRHIGVTRIDHKRFGTVYAVDGTPADCVRLALSELVNEKIDLLVSGINEGANLGVDTFYSGTIAGAREGAIHGVPSVAVSQAVRKGTDVRWEEATRATRELMQRISHDELPGPGFLSVNLPAVVPDAVWDHVRKVPVATETVPLSFERADGQDGQLASYRYGKSYWGREANGETDFMVVREGSIALSAIPLFGRF